MDSLESKGWMQSLSKERLVAIVFEQQAQIDAFQQQVVSLTERLLEAEEKLSKHSQNSSKPPSSDGYQKPCPKSQRKKSDKKVGGQKGHEGSTLTIIDNPDEVEVHEVDICSHCGASLEQTPVASHECRQEFDIIKPRRNVTEHRAQIKKCPYCGQLNKGTFPSQITQPVQYGSQVKTCSTYFNQNHLVPFNRVQEIFEDCYGLHISQGSLVNFNKQCYQALAGTEDLIKQGLIESQVVNFDESGMRSQGKLHWLHVASTEKLTYYCLHEKRGKVAIDAMNILPQFTGKAIHDHWKPYFSYSGCTHGLCNAHHLRELNYVEEQYEQGWAKQMHDHLLVMKETVDKSKAAGASKLSSEIIDKYEHTYQDILQAGFEQIPVLEKPAKQRGRPKQHKSKNLWDRLSNYQPEVLGYIHDFSTPFDNNQGERDIRMCKTKQKISGCFRSELGGKIFCRIRGYISTAKKNDENVLEALNSAFIEKPFSPDSVRPIA